MRPCCDYAHLVYPRQGTPWPVTAATAFVADVNLEDRADEEAPVMFMDVEGWRSSKRRPWAFAFSGESGSPKYGGNISWIVTIISAAVFSSFRVSPRYLRPYFCEDLRLWNLGETRVA
jgi:hypothetical protein